MMGKLGPSGLGNQVESTGSFGQCGKAVLKLVINTHMEYLVPLRTMFSSLIGVGFRNYDDVIVVQGGALLD